MAECLFCRIVDGEIPADVVHETERVLAFRDIRPQAPVHVLVIPKKHYANAGELGVGDPALAGEVLEVAAAVAAKEGVAEHGYRFLFNTGPHSGQEVFHVHGHVLGGRPLGPMLAPRTA